MAAIAVGTFVFQSCNDKEKVDPKPPTMNFLGGVGYTSSDVTIGVGTPFTIGITANHSSKMKNFKVTLSTDGGVALPVLDSSINTENLTYSLTDVAASTVGVTKQYSFTVTDKDGLSTTITITITAATTSSTLIESTTDVKGKPFRVWHIKGPNSGAFDLLNGNALTIDDPNSEKDIVDSTAIAEIKTWPARWESRNETRFKKVTSKYSAITNTTDLQNAWNNSGTNELRFYTGIKKDDVFIFKLRNDPSKLVLVGITDVVNTGEVDNLDYVQFIFKKAP